MQNDLLSELKQVFLDAQANAARNARFRLFFKALCSFLARIRRQASDVFVPPVDARAQNDLLGSFKRAVHGVRASTAYNASLRPFFEALCDLLVKAQRRAEGWISSACVVGHIFPPRPKVRLKIECVIVVISLLMYEGRLYWGVFRSPHANGS